MKKSIFQTPIHHQEHSKNEISSVFIQKQNQKVKTAISLALRHSIQIYLQWFLNSQSIFYMPRRAQKQKKAVISNEETFGRPRDDLLQSAFMKLLRKYKLQAINAESVAELECNKFTTKKAKVNSKSEELEDESAQKIDWVKNMFFNINQHRYSLLFNAFMEAVNKWEFKEIHSEAQLPEYLFLDEVDLSHILFCVLNSSISELKNKMEFSNEELLFFELLSFATRDMIPLRVLQSIEKNFNYLLGKMNRIKEKIMCHYEKSQNMLEERNESESQRDQYLDSIFNNDNSFVEPRPHFQFGQPPEEVQEEEQEEDEPRSVRGGKTKGIKKEQKKKAPKSKEKLKDLTSEQLDEVMKKLTAHITWSYRYIYPEEVKKKRRLM